LQEYENKYVKEKITGDSKDNLEMDDKSTINLLTPITEMAGGVGDVELKIKEEKMDPPEEEEEEEDVEMTLRNPFHDVTKEDRPWYQQCLYVCQICQSTYYSTSALNNHTKVKHNMEREAYLAQFGTKGKLIEDYNCKICNRVMKCEGKALGSHMKNVHKMSIEEYTRVHEPDRNTEHDPNFYNESYQIEIGGGEEEEEDIGDIGVDHEDPLTNSALKDSSYDPLADIEIGNVVSGENLNFSFEDEEESIASEDYVEGFGHPNIVEPKIDLKITDGPDQREASASSEKPSINTQTIKNIVSKTLFKSGTTPGNPLNNNSESLITPPPLSSSSPTNNEKESTNEDLPRSPALPETCQVKENDPTLPANESQSIISLELLDRNDESFTTDPDAPSDHAELPAEEESHTEEESEPHASNVPTEGTVSNNFGMAVNSEPGSTHELYMTELNTAETGEDTPPSDDFPDIDFSSVSMGVLELNNEDGNLLG